jgi:hypothetical protein
LKTIHATISGIARSFGFIDKPKPKAMANDDKKLAQLFAQIPQLPS